jgi:hypothetical protein
VPTKRTFDLIVITTLGVHFAFGLVKLWAHRTNAEPGDGPLSRVAEAVVVAG